jgi:serine/threonine-protein kinase RsbW
VSANVSLTIPAKPEYIALCRLALAGIARIGDLEEETVADLKLALTEACSNSVKHAYASGRGGVVEVRYELDGDRLVVEVVDQGDGFDPAVVESMERADDEGGLGIAIIRAVTDELDIGSTPGGEGSRLRFVKVLSR